MIDVCCHIKVVFRSIETLQPQQICLPGKEHNFDKYNLNEIDYLSEVYDTESIMHYGKSSFSTNGQPTIQALGNPDKQLGQRNGFSKTDIAQLNALYDCSGNIH